MQSLHFAAAQRALAPVAARSRTIAARPTAHAGRGNERRMAPAPCDVNTDEIDTAEVLALLRDAAAHYRAALGSERAPQDYLSRRGITPAAARLYGIGYARPAWRDLTRVLAPYSQGAIDASGLLARGATGCQYDHLRDRIVFPISTATGQVIAFGGRALQDDAADARAPKYANTAETALFRKAAVLYGVHQASQSIRAQGRVFVVEGYIDVVALAQEGQRNVVGTMGTAFTAEHVDQLSGIARHITFCFDGDDAGRRAAERALERLAPRANGNLQVDFAMLPEGHDPDSLVRAGGLSAFARAAAAAVDLPQLALRIAAQGCDLTIAEGRARCSARLGQQWVQMADGMARDTLLLAASGLLALGEAEIRRIWLSASRRT